MQAYHFGCAAQKTPARQPGRPGSKRGDGWAGSCPSPKGINQRILGERVRWGERLELLLGHSVSQWGANSICAGTFFIVRDITEGLVAWSLCSKCQQPPLLCPSYCDNEEQP